MPYDDDIGDLGNDIFSDDLDRIGNLDSPMNLYNNAERPGVYLHWDRMSSTPVAFYQILRAEQIDGNYQVVATVVFPGNDFVDSEGHPSFYYKVREIDPANTAIATSAPRSGDELLINASLAFQVKDLLQVAVYDEEAIFGRDRTKARFAFKNWNAWPRAEIRMSGPSNDGDRDSLQILDDVTPIFTSVNGADNYPSGLKYQLDYQGGVYFKSQTDQPVPVDSADFLLGSYNVRLFNGSEMNNALYMALQSLNAQPGTAKYPTVASVPFFYDAALICGATYYLLRALLVGLTQREKRLLLQDPENGAYDTVASLRETAKMYEEEWKEFQKSIPRARYPMTVSIVTPEYFLPGGRSRMFRYLWKGGA
jgi:hypothetical protein